MPKNIDVSFLDWTQEHKPAIRRRGIAALAVSVRKPRPMVPGGEKLRCIWPSGFENLNSRVQSRRILGAETND